MYLDNVSSVESGLERSGGSRSSQGQLSWAKHERQVLERSTNYRRIRTLEPDIISEINCYI